MIKKSKLKKIIKIFIFKEKKLKYKKWVKGFA